jgi:hypothetical protein
MLLGAGEVLLFEDEELVVRGCEIVLARRTALGDEIHVVGGGIGARRCPERL